MRASGSHSVSFEDVPLPASALRGGFAAGEAVEYMERNAELGRLPCGRRARRRRERRTRMSPHGSVAREVDPRALMLAAENVVDLAACRAILARSAAFDRRAAASGSRRDSPWT